MTRPAIPDDEHLEEDLVYDTGTELLDLFQRTGGCIKSDALDNILRTFALKVVEASVPEKKTLKKNWKGDWEIERIKTSTFNECRHQTLSNARALLGIEE